MNYYSKLLPWLATILSPIYSLLRRNNKWHWGDKQQSAFNTAKDQLSSAKLLVHYDPDRELLLSCDASPYGIGAVLSQITPDKEEKPIAFALRSLAPVEQKYSQLDIEGLSIILESESFTSIYLAGSLPYSLTTDLFNTFLVKLAQFHTWLRPDCRDEHLP